MATNIEEKRKPNWGEMELQVLRDTIDLKKDILFCRQANVDTMSKKKRAWDHVADQVSAVGKWKRTGEECRRKWTVIKSQVKTKVASNRKERVKTGGGPSIAVPLTAFEEGAAALLSREVTEGVRGGIDTAAADVSEDSSEVSLFLKIGMFFLEICVK